MVSSDRPGEASRYGLARGCRRRLRALIDALREYARYALGITVRLGCVDFIMAGRCRPARPLDEGRPCWGEVDIYRTKMTGVFNSVHRQHGTVCGTSGEERKRGHPQRSIQLSSRHEHATTIAGVLLSGE